MRWVGFSLALPTKRQRAERREQQQESAAAEALKLAREYDLPHPGGQS